MAATARALPLPAAAPTRWRSGVLATVLLAVALVAGLAVGGLPGSFSRTGLPFVPPLALIGVLQLRRWRAGRIASWTLFWPMMLLMAVLVLALTALSIAPDRSLAPDAAGRVVVPSLAVLIIVLLGAALTVTSLWFPLARRLGAHVERSDPAHAQGTVGLLLVTALATAPLALLGGRAPLATLLSDLETSSATATVGEQFGAQIFQWVWTVVLVIWATGWPWRAGLQSAFTRLGLQSLRVRDAVPLGAIVLAAVAVGMGIDTLNQTVLSGLGIPLTDGSIVTRLVPIAATPVGAVVVAVCAGTSEELIFRGLLQPRFGWLLPNLGFAAIHAFQYGLDGLLVVFALGAVLAFVRRRWNTTASMAVHSSYDGILLLLGILTTH